MRVIDEGHRYAVQNVDDEGEQYIQFVKRRGWDAEELPDAEKIAGIQSQELLRVLIDRTIYLHSEQAWHENVEIINHLRDALRLYESRAAHRHLQKLGMPERATHCKICGHIFCFGHGI